MKNIKIEIIVKYVLILLMLITFASCVGYSASSSVGLGVNGGPCGWNTYPGFNSTGYRGGYLR